MTKPIPGIKIPYWKAEQYPVPEGLRCVEIMIPDDDSFMALLGGLLKLPGRSFNWENETFEKRLALAQVWKNAYNATDWEQCMNCEQLIECLQPLFDAIDARFDTLDTAMAAVQAVTDAVAATQAENAAQLPAAQTTSVLNQICGGATGVVEYMDFVNMRTYNEAEVSTLDNVFEAIPAIIEAFPLLGNLPFDELFELVDWYFENQVTTYETDFAAVKADLISDLACHVQANGGEFTVDVWGDWLEYVGTTYPANKAAQLFARYAPARQTFLNQIAALINHDQSLAAYFEEITTAYLGGTENPVSCVTTCDWEEITDYVTGQNVDKWEVVAGEIVPDSYIENELLNGLNSYQVVALVRTVAATSTLTYIKVEGTFSAGTYDVTGDSSWYFEWGTIVENILIPAVPTMPIELTGLSAAGGNVGLQLMCGAQDAGNVDPGGTARITRITLQGQGIAP